MIKQVSLKHDISITRKKQHTMESLFLGNVTETLMQRSFYLPADVRNSPDYVLAKPVLLSNSEFFEFLARLPRPDLMHYDGSQSLIHAARWVILSQRSRCYPADSWYVCKVWYGEKP